MVEREATPLVIEIAKDSWASGRLQSNQSRRVITGYIHSAAYSATSPETFNSPWSRFCQSVQSIIRDTYGVSERIRGRFALKKKTDK